MCCLVVELFRRYDGCRRAKLRDEVWQRIRQSRLTCVEAGTPRHYSKLRSFKRKRLMYTTQTFTKATISPIDQKVVWLADLRY